MFFVTNFITFIKGRGISCGILSENIKGTFCYSVRLFKNNLIWRLLTLTEMHFIIFVFLFYFVCNSEQLTTEQAVGKFNNIQFHPHNLTFDVSEN